MELITERLIIRTLENTDYPNSVINNVDSFANDTRGLFNWIVSQYDNMDIVNDIISLGVFLRETGEYCGYVGAGKHAELQEPEIFYEFLPEKSGFGYASEAAIAVTKWVFENYEIPYLIGTVGVDNMKSQRVLERSGYQLIDYRTSLMPQPEGKHSDYKYYRCYPAG
ncbi:GNAT family N-acetyltransferase [Paenibacillus sp. CF384]|uniref:GNAT family N-acetyltransferase n=1 Tax=Paenibacillus sp. CF384 TaxID=1884382 RepID=UPI0008995928|nr:GNAT family N-acetyltransferase [Paenibacillus sp. CF384]SDW08789.1 Protein N-acetyltransferase, RimJ/RimL family [Paenibacillus sp. CF384]